MITRRLTTPALVAVLLLSGCGSGSSAVADPTSTMRSVTATTAPMQPTATQSTTSAAVTATATPSASESATPTTSSATSTSATPSATTPAGPPPPGYPDAATVQSADGAKALIGYFFDQVNTMLMGPTPGLVEAISDRRCMVCSLLEYQAADLQSKGQRYDSAQDQVGTITAIPGVSTDVLQFLVEVESLGAQVVDADGGVVSTDEAFTDTYRTEVSWVGGWWKLTQIEADS